MKKVLLYFVFSLILVNFSYAQSNYPISIGIELGYKAGINAADVPQGTKNGVSFADLPDFGLQGYLPFQGDNNMGVLGNLGYYTFPYKFTFEGNNSEIKYNFRYIAFGLDFYLSGFTIGLNYGFPSAAKIEDKDLNTDLLANLFEFRLGGHIPMLYTDFGRLNFNIKASYFISGQYNDNNILQGKNTNPASLSFGVSFLFDLNPKEE